MLWFEESTHSPAQYVTRQENCIFSFAELYWTKPFVVLCPSDLFSWYLFEELTMLGCYQLCPGNSSPGGTGWRRRTPLLTQCLESQNNIQTFLTNKSIFLTQRKTIFWWPYQHHDLWVCLVLASFILLCRLQIKLEEIIRLQTKHVILPNQTLLDLLNVNEFVRTPLYLFPIFQTFQMFPVIKGGTVNEKLQS